MGDPKKRRRAVIDLEHFFLDCFPEYNHIIHDGSLSPPSYLSEIKWDAILIGSTFLCKVVHPEEFAKAKKDFSWIKDSESIKFAFPQDDYYCSNILDQWMVDWNIDFVYSVLFEHRETLYPKYMRHGEIRKGFTAYIKNSWIEKWKNPKKIGDRSIDISYRSSNLGAYCGTVGFIKGNIGNIFKNKTKDLNLNIDISSDEKDAIPGDQWHEFMEDSKFCLATPSGSSLLDPNGDFRKKITDYVKENPKKNFFEISQYCFPGQDKKYNFTALSPRNLEAALCETVQIATIGNYSDLMQPYEDYIPLDEDCSNIEEVLKLINDKEICRKIAKNFKAKILNTPELYLNNHANEVNQTIIKYKQKHSIVSDDLIRLRNYKKFERTNLKVFWLIYSFKQYIKLIIKYLFYKKI